MKLAALWRHPIKSHGREALTEVTLSPGQTMPWDRRWAVAHEAAKIDGEGWAHCANFSRAAKEPSLMAITATSDEAENRVTLRHPDLAPLRFDPDREEQAFLDWIRPLMPEGRAQPARIVRAPGRGMTDSDFPSISLLNRASHDAVASHLGREDLSLERWRGNLHIEGAEAWEEFSWLGRSLRIGEAILDIRERITRCMATTANPATGERDADTLGALRDGFGHQEFGVYAVVRQGGSLRRGDTVEVL
ncbi:MOSC domain-containing protein [Roseovarius nubinhibens]|uniref:MOSC domain-containing protein n=1 Tax=Roseovarius nubinhibens TaxID=314263 RepID=UPI001C0828FC|nr:MOSC N-terminal beta barrel domain-containing protein [Roseovarius nubinhibens]MBU2999006.1 MOSC domain-containing protein [Roseovarius nubinhibens]